jgi:P27 family predicted phage terminase small subunit
MYMQINDMRGAYLLLWDESRQTGALGKDLRPRLAIGGFNGGSPTGDVNMPQRKKPTYLRVLNGNPSKRPLNLREPKPTGDLHEPPVWLTEAQKEGWAYAVTHAPPGLLKRLDRSILTIWVIAEDCHKQASEKVAEHGMLIKAPHTGEPMQSPYMAIQNKQALIMLRAGAEMGFSPVSRASISMAPDDGANPFSRNGRGRPPDAA